MRAKKLDSPPLAALGCAHVQAARSPKPTGTRPHHAVEYIDRRMKFVVHSAFADGIAPFTRRFQHYPIFFQVCCGVSHVIVFICYLGALVSFTIVFGVPIMILGAFRLAPPSIAFWISAALLSACAVWQLYRSGAAFIHSIRHRVVHLEALVVFWCIVLAIACHIGLILRRGGF